MQNKRELKLILFLIVIFLIVSATIPLVLRYSIHQNDKHHASKPSIPVEKPIDSLPDLGTTISINAIGDCLLNRDTHFNYGDRGYDKVFAKNGPDYFLANFKDMFSRDDLTIANLETAITNADESYRVEKVYNFKAPAEYLKILTNSSIDVVNIANNHTYDYGSKGYQDTKNNLDQVHLPYYGNDSYSILQVKDVKIGLAGLYCAEDEVTDCKPDTLKALNYLKNQQVDMIIMTYHWGIELALQQSKSQESLAHYAIDNGADLVLGHHPHCLQGIELYKDKYIVYSLGNFTFDGHWNPTYYETMVFHADLTFKDKQLTSSKIKVIPAMVSSTPKPINDYKPRLAEGEEKTKILNQVQEHSKNVTITS